MVNYFKAGFIGFFVFILAALVFLFRTASAGEYSAEVLTAIWSSVILVGVIIGIVLISFYIEYMRNRGAGQKVPKDTVKIS
jgi:hypothetical protein